MVWESRRCWPAEPETGSEDGSATTLMLVGLVFTLLLMAWVINAGLAVARKVERINAADAVAAALGVLLSETVNGIVQLNHQAGETLASVVVVAAVVGRNAAVSDLPASDRARAGRLDVELNELAALLEWEGQDTEPTRPIHHPIRVGGTVGLARIRLKQALAVSYLARLGFGPVVAGLGDGPMMFEWVALDQVEREFRSLLAERQQGVTATVPARLHDADTLVADHPRKVARLLQAVGDELEVRAGVYPAHAPLPVAPEGFDGDDPDRVRALGGSRIVAAAWPWVLYDRNPILLRLEPLRISGAAAIYRTQTRSETVNLAAEVYRRAGGSTMWVLVDSQPATWGREAWRDDRDRADRRFGYLALAFRPAEAPLARGLFPRSAVTSGGTVAHAQVLMADPPRQGADPSRPNAALFQPSGGWDTLGWLGRVAAYPFEPATGANAPGVQPGWVSRIAPATRLNEAGPRLPAPFATPIAPLLPVADHLQNH